MIGQHVDPAKTQRARELRHTMTPSEKRLWEALRNNQLGVRFRRQQVVLGFIADFYCHPACLVVEVDGAVHQTQREADAERDGVFEGAGLLVWRVSNDAVERDVTSVVNRIRRLCDERAVHRRRDH